MTSPVYGTDAELTAYSADDQLIAKASRLIDSILIGAVYPVDVNGVATDVGIAVAIKQATLAQAAFWRSGAGSVQGPSQYRDVAIGSVRLSGGQSGPTTKVLVAPQAIFELSAVGLLPISARTVG